MPAIALLAIKLAFLALLWLFVLAAMRAIRLDIFGPRVPKAARPSKRAARARAQAPPPAPRPARAASGRSGGKAPRILHVTEGALAGTKLPLDGTPITIGRAPGSTLLLTDDYVSSHHARIFSRDGAWLVEDMGSTNGTFVGSGKVTGPTPIGPGAKVRVGKTVLELRR
jgi:pSer/pThr/pTyr-binding forkhead associated (FHA) protein